MKQSPDSTIGQLFHRLTCTPTVSIPKPTSGIWLSFMSLWNSRPVPTLEMGDSFTDSHAHQMLLNPPCIWFSLIPPHLHPCFMPTVSCCLHSILMNTKFPVPCCACQCVKQSPGSSGTGWLFHRLTCTPSFGIWFSLTPPTCIHALCLLSAVVYIPSWWIQGFLFHKKYINKFMAKVMQGIVGLSHGITRSIFIKVLMINNP